ncbi:MAG: secretin N-terminal domain-containing protein [Pirellulaceae bacterium]
MAWATPGDHEILMAAIEQLSTSMAEADQRQLEVLSLDHVTATTTLTVLQSMFPEASLTLDSANHRLIARAVAEDLTAIKTLLEQLQADREDPDAPVLKSYPLDKPLDATVITSLSSLAPQATITAQDEQLLVVASPREQEIIKKTLEEVVSTLPGPQRNALTIYTVTPAQKKRFLAILASVTTELPGIQVITEDKPGELSVWAKPQQHTVISQILEQLNRDIPEQDRYQLFVLPLAKGSAANVLPVIQELYPDLKVIQDPSGQRVLLWTNSQQQTAIQKTLEQLEAHLAADRPRFEVYTVRGINPSTALTQVQPLVPDAKLSVDVETGKLIAWASPAEHEILTEMLRKLTEPESPLEVRQLEVFPLAKADPTATMTLLQSLMPTVKLTLDSANGQVIAVAVPQDLLAIRALLEQLQAHDGQEHLLTAYALQVTEAATALEMLAELYPNAKIVVDEASNRLLIWAEPSEHEQIKASIEQLDAGEPVDRKERFMVHPLPSASGPTALAVLQQLLPDAQLTYDATSENLTAWARARDHEVIEELIEQLREGGAEGSLAVYQAKNVSGADAVALLDSAVPKAQLTLGSDGVRILAWAQPGDHKQIEKLLQQMEQQELEEGRTLTAYPLKGVEPQALQEVLQPLMESDDQIVSDEKRKALIVWTTPEKHERIKQALDRLAEQMPGAGTAVTTVYHFKNASASAVQQALSGVLTGATMALDTLGNSLIVTGSPEDQAVVKATVEQIDRVGLDSKATVQVYRLKSADPSNVYAVLTSLYRTSTDVSLTTDTQHRALIAVAPPAQQKAIQQVIQQLEEQGTLDDRVLAVYPLADEGNEAFVKVLEPLAEEKVTYVHDERRKSLIVWASPEQHDKIQQAFQELTRALPQPEMQLTLAYRLKNASAAAAQQVLAGVLPNVTPTLDSQSNSLIITASIKDHTTARTIIEHVDQAGRGDRGTVKVYRLKAAEPSTVNSVLQSLLQGEDGLQITLGGDHQSLVAIASEEQHELIEQVVQQFELEGVNGDQVLAVYPLGKEDSTSFVQALEPLLQEGVTYVSDERRKSLIVWATSEQHAKVKQAFEQLTSALPQPQPRITTVFRLKDASLTAVQQVLSELLTEASIVLDPEGKSIVVTADAEDQATAKTLIEQMDAADKEGRVSVQIYRLQSADASIVTTVLTSLLKEEKGIELTPDVANRAIIAIAPPEQQKFIAQIVQQMDEQTARDDQVLAVYPLDSDEASAFTQALAPFQEQGASYVHDVSRKSLVVWATAKQHERIKETFGELAANLPAADKPTTVVYHLKKASASAAYTALYGTLPKARIGLDTTSNNLVVTATAEDHAIVKATVEQMDEADDQGIVQVYSLKKADPTGVYTVLSALYQLERDVRLTLDTKNRSIIAVASPEKHKHIQEIIQKVEEQGTDKDQVLAVYPLESEDSVSFLEVLDPLLQEGIKYINDERRNSLVVWASQEQHDNIQSAFSQLAENLPEPRKPTTVVYHFENATASAAYYALYQYLKDASFGLDTTGNNLVATASAEDHEIIKATVQEMDRADDQGMVQVYSLKKADPTGVYTVLSALYQIERDVRLTLDTKNRSIIAVASPEKQKHIQEIIQKIEEQGTKEDQILTVYPMDSDDSTAFMDVLEPLLQEGITYVNDDRRNSLIVWATQEQHTKIQKAFQQLTDALPEADKPTTVVYHLEDGSASAAYTALYSMMPTARIGLDTTGNSLVVTATSEDHEIVKATVEQMDKVGLGENSTVQVYSLESADPTSVSTALLSLYRLARDVRISVDSRSESIIAVAPAKEQEVIADLIEKIEAAGGGAGELTTEVHHMKFSNPVAAYRALTTLLPNARLGFDVDGKNLVITANEEDHALAKAVVDKMEQVSQEGRGTMQVHRLKIADPNNVYTVLTALYRLSRDVRISADDKNRAIVAVAPPEEQRRIQEMITQLDVPATDREGWTTQVYHFQAADPQAAQLALDEMVPEARIFLDARGMNLVVTASPEDHVTVKATVDQMDQATLADRGTVEVHQLKTANPQNVYLVLNALYLSDTNTRISVDAKNRAIIAVASPEQQDVIRKTIEQIEAQAPGEEGWTTQVYHFKETDPATAQQALVDLVPDARVFLDSVGRNLVVTASEEDHLVVKDTAEQMKLAGLQDRGTMQVYQLKTADPEDLESILQALYADRDQIRISADSRNRTIVAVAPTEEQAAIRQMIEQVESQDATKGWSTEVYHLKISDPQAAYMALSRLLPNVRIAYDTDGNNLLVTGREEDHAIVKTTVEQMDLASMDGLAAPKVYRLESIDPEDVFEVMQSLYEGDKEVRISLDRSQEAIVVVALPAEHEAIKTLIDDLESGALDAEGTSLVAYDLGETDSDALLMMLSDLFSTEIDEELIQISVLPSNNKLVAIARPKDQELIRSALEELKVEDRQLEVFQLQVVDPFTAETAIDSLFGGMLDAPYVDTDPSTQQIFVRGTAKQLDNVRELLVKMGEIHLSVASPRRPGSGRLRVIPFNTDSGAAIEELQRIWPQLRKNEIRVIRPKDRVPRLRPSPPAKKDEEDKQKSKQPDSGENGESQGKDEQAFDEPMSDLLAMADDIDLSLEQPAEDAASSPDELPPVVIVEGDGNITIASEDTEALDQIEALLMALSRETTGIGRNFVVFSLRNAGAVQVAETIERLFRGIGTDWRGGTGKVVAIPDERLNAILVYAGRSDQSIVENLIRVLDTSDIPDALALIRPKLIPIKNAQVKEIEDVLRDTYSTQLKMGGGRRQIDIPRGVPREVASVMRQLNAATSGPMLTLATDDLTNTLIVMGPADLVEEIESVVTELDDAALRDNPTRALRILSLKKMSSDRIDEALDILLDRRRSSSSRRRR